MHRRATVTAVTVALALAGAVGGWNAASATPVCASVSSNGTLVGPHQAGPACVPYPYPVNCRTTTGGLDPQVTVTVDVCVPAP